MRVWFMINWFIRECLLVLTGLVTERKRKRYEYCKLKRQKAVQSGKENQKDPSYPEVMGCS